MKLRDRLHLLGVASLVTTVALVATVLWGASEASQVLADRRRVALQSESYQALAAALPALLLGSGDSADRTARARDAIDRAATRFDTGGAREDLERLRRGVDELARLRSSAPDRGQAENFERAILDPLAAMAAHLRRLDADASAHAAQAISTSVRVASATALLALLVALFGALTITPRLRIALAALEAGATRVGAGDLATRIALPGKDELASLGDAFDAMAARLEQQLTSREQAEALARERTAELERARQDLADRVAQLENVQIQLEASDRLVAANRLARGLTHELNNPLAILLADVEFAKEELEAQRLDASDSLEEVRSALDEARQAGRRIALIVRELMSFSRERAAGDRGLADLVETIEHAQRLAAPEIRRHASFVVEVPSGPLLVQGTESRLGQAFLELLLGAASAVAELKGTPGRVRLSLRAAPGGAVVEVADNGQPIADDLKQHLFDPFYLSTAGFTAGGSGLRGAGLGLASCSRILQAAGGNLECESSPAAGTLFRAWLPAATSLSRVALSAPRLAGESGRGRILVLDTDPFECAATYRALAREFDVAPHASVPSALAVIRAGDRFDLILCDRSSGPCLHEALVADGSTQADKVVLLGLMDGEDVAAPRGDLPTVCRPATVDQIKALARSEVACNRKSRLSMNP